PKRLEAEGGEAARGEDRQTVHGPETEPQQAQRVACQQERPAEEREQEQGHGRDRGCCHRVEPTLANRFPPSTPGGGDLLEVRPEQLRSRDDDDRLGAVEDLAPGVVERAAELVWVQVLGRQRLEVVLASDDIGRRELPDEAQVAGREAEVRR